MKNFYSTAIILSVCFASASFGQASKQDEQDLRGSLIRALSTYIDHSSSLHIQYKAFTKASDKVKEIQKEEEGKNVARHFGIIGEEIVDWRSTGGNSLVKVTSKTDGNSEAKFYTTPHSTIQHSVTRSTVEILSGQWIPVLSPLELAGLRFGHAGGFTTLSDIAGKSSTVIEEKVLDEKKRIVMFYHDGTWAIKAILAPEAAFLPIKIEIFNGKMDLVSTQSITWNTKGKIPPMEKTEITGFVVPNDPTSWFTTIYEITKYDQTKEGSLKAPAISEFAKGTLVIDRTQGKTFRVGN